MEKWSNLRQIINDNINDRGTILHYHIRVNANLQYRVIKGFAQHCKTDVRTGYRLYADWVVTGKYK